MNKRRKDPDNKIVVKGKYWANNLAYSMGRKYPYVDITTFDIPGFHIPKAMHCENCDHGIDKVGIDGVYKILCKMFSTEDIVKAVDIYGLCPDYKRYEK